MKVKVVYSWACGISDTIMPISDLAGWLLMNKNFRILNIVEHKEEFVELTEDQKKQIDSAYQAQWDELSKLPSEPMPDESMTEWEKQELEEKFRKKYQGKAILNTEEEKDESLTTSIGIACIMISLACLKYIVL